MFMVYLYSVRVCVGFASLGTWINVFCRLTAGLLGCVAYYCLLVLGRLLFVVTFGFAFFGICAWFLFGMFFWLLRGRCLLIVCFRLLAVVGLVGYLAVC